MDVGVVEIGPFKPCRKGVYKREKYAPYCTTVTYNR